MRCCLGMTLLLAGFLAVHAAGSAQENDQPKKTPTVIGSWALVSLEREGKALRGDNSGGGNLVVEQKRFSLSFKDGSIDGTYSLQASRTPLGIDVTISEGPNKGKTQRGIYEVTAQELKLCFAAPGKTDRPTRFETKPRSDDVLFTLKRKLPGID